MKNLVFTKRAKVGYAVAGIVAVIIVAILLATGGGSKTGIPKGSRYHCGAGMISFPLWPKTWPAMARMPRTQIFFTAFHERRGRVIHRGLRGAFRVSPRPRLNNSGNRIRGQRGAKK